MSKRAAALILLFATVALHAFASPSSLAEGRVRPCISDLMERLRAGESSYRLQAPPVLSRHPHAVVLKSELPSCGTLVEPGTQALKDLPDGTYIYSITQDGRTIFSPIVPDIHVDVSKPDAKFLATHRGMIQRLKEVLKTDQDPPIVASGEFEVRSGRVSMFNNQSGTFRGDGRHLAYADLKLRSQGLRIEARTRRIDLSKATNLKEPHRNRERTAADIIRYSRDPLTPKVQELFRHLAEKFPDPEHPGYPDLDRMSTVYMKKYQELIEEGVEPEVEDLVTDSLVLYTYLVREDPSFLVEHLRGSNEGLLPHENPEKFLETMRLLVDEEHRWEAPHPTPGKTIELDRRRSD